jgi:hypothetical protein
VLRSGNPAQDGTHPRDQLLVDERAHDVVVGAAREPAHPVGGVAAGADHDHRHVAVPRPARFSRPQAPADVEARGVGQARFQENEVGALALEERERLRRPVGREDREAVIGELAREVGPRRGLALDQENRFAHRSRR